jgi:uncharacterized phage-associated protein
MKIDLLWKKLHKLFYFAISKMLSVMENVFI